MGVFVYGWWDSEESCTSIDISIASPPYPEIPGTLHSIYSHKGVFCYRCFPHDLDWLFFPFKWHMCAHVWSPLLCVLLSSSTHMQDLQEVTQDLHYENFRSERLKRGGRSLSRCPLVSMLCHPKLCCLLPVCVQCGLIDLWATWSGFLLQDPHCWFNRIVFSS